MEEHTYQRVARELERVRGQIAHLYDSQRDALTAEASFPPELAGAALRDYQEARGMGWGAVNGLYAAVAVIDHQLLLLKLAQYRPVMPSGQSSPGARPNDAVRTQRLRPLEPDNGL